MLLAVKLFRPKHLSDFWVIQTIGVMIVTLSCVLAGDPVFAGLLFAYLASLLWCLALFQLYRAGRPVDGPLFTPAGEPRPEAAMPWHHLGLDRACRWSLAVLAIALPLFLIMPRSSSSQWVPQKLSSTAAVALSVGVESGINLNRVGTVELSPKPAFHVSVADPAGNPARLDSEQLWCVDTLDYYVNGHWTDWVQAREYFHHKLGTPFGGAMPGLAGDEPVMPQRPALPPPLPKNGQMPALASPMLRPAGVLKQAITPSVPPPRPGQRCLRYTVRPTTAGGLVLAEPLDIRHVGIDAMIGDFGRGPGFSRFTRFPAAIASTATFRVAWFTPIPRSSRRPMPRNGCRPGITTGRITITSWRRRCPTTSSPGFGTSCRI